MSSIVKIEKELFSDLQSEFFKLMFLINKHKKNYNDYDKYFIELNNDIQNLEEKIKDIKYTIFSTNQKMKLSNTELENYEKNNLVIDAFKPLMVSYRHMLN